MLLLGDGLVDWEEVDHPVYGKVEVGGLKKNWGRQPPGFMLQEECHRNMAFTLFHADQMPLVAIRDVTVRPIDHDLHEVTAVIENQRLTPTHSAVDRRQKITRPNHVSLQAAGLNVVMGHYSSDVLFRQSSIQRKHAEVVHLPVIPGRSVIYVQWIVSGSGGGLITLDSIKGGYASKTFQVP